MDRGVIASPGIITPLPGGFRMDRSISAEELRYYLMYWDKVIIPGNNLVYIGVPEEEQLLELGAIERPRVGFHGMFAGDMVTNALLSCQGIVAKELMRDKEIDWVIHQIGATTSISNEYSEKRNVIRVDLSAALPVPSGDVRVEDVLEFKAQRSAELKALHEVLDQLYEEILTSPDKDLAAKKVTSRFQQSVNDLEKASSEKFERTRKFDFSAELNLSGKDISVGAASGAAFDFFTTGFTIPVATVVGAIASTINIKSKATNTFQPAAENTKLSYLSHASDEGITGKAHKN